MPLPLLPLPLLPRTSWTQTRGGHLTCRRSRRREVHQGEQTTSVITGHTNTRNIRPPDNTWAKTHEPLAWRTPERTPMPGYRASSCHIDTEGTRETGDMDIKQTQRAQNTTTKRTRGRTWEKTPPERKRDLMEFAVDLHSGNAYDATQHYRLRLYPCPCARDSGHIWTWL